MTNVYILDFGNRIKIGRTKNISQRIKTIENSAGEKVKQVFFLETDAIKEQILHSYLQEYRTVGEFFTCSFEIAKTAFQNIVDEQTKSLISKKSSKRNNYELIEHNYFTRNARYNLSAQEHKIILYLISQVKRNSDFQIFEFKIKEFCKLLGIPENNGGNYQALKESVISLYDKNISIKSNNGADCMLKWIEPPSLNKDSGTIYMRLNNDLSPYLLEFASKAASYNLHSLLKMKSKYSIRLYELLKSYENLGKCEFEIDRLKKLLDAANYDVFANFKAKVLDIAVREINDYSDIHISYELEKQGRKFHRIKFMITLRYLLGVDECIKMYRNVSARLDK